MGDEFSLEDALIILQRRFLYFLLPVLLLAPLGVLIVVMLPAQYAAQGTILVESAQIPTELIRSTVDTYAQERIQTIRQRVMTRNRLLEIADKYKLFPRESGFSSSERVEKMRARMKINLITAQGSRSSRQRDGTIAFTVSYTDESPQKAFQVANEFMSLFLTEDVRSRTAGASNTTEFFEQEANRLGQTVDALEQRIAEYKEQNADALPEHLNLHLDMLERAQRDLSSNEASLAALEEEVRFLETQMASYFSGAAGQGGPAEKLAQLKSELVSLRAVYQDKHPSVQAVRDQIRALETELRPSREIQQAQSDLARAENELNKLERAAPEGDPQIDSKRSEIEALQKTLSDRISRETQSGGNDFLSSNLQGRIAVANSRRSLLEGQQDELKRTIADLQARIARTPEVERGLQGLTRNYEQFFKQYQDVLSKQQDAQLAENLEDNQKAEKFSILEPAQKPDSPTSPDRGKLIVLALFVALAAGGGAALGAELLLSTLRGRNHLSKVIDAHPIAVIPHFRRESDKRVRKAVIGGRTAPVASALMALFIAAGAVTTQDQTPSHEQNIQYAA